MTDVGGSEYCAIYVAGADRQTVTDLIAAALHAAPSGYCVARAGVDFEVRPNPDAALATGFIGWPLKIDADGPMPALAHAVARVLTTVRTAGYQATAACDFEEQLPHQHL
ncbi:hypothetical protein [Kitasatospora sp. NPDC096140]|uniref:hypothetical protein n=1 Tax=Kitasatospora sp. NPDC096140 TaxID=3155425 RepID=UPI0033322224